MKRFPWKKYEFVYAYQIHIDPEQEGTDIMNIGEVEKIRSIEKELRRECGLTVEEVVEKSGVDYDEYIAFSKENGSLTADTAILLARFYDVDMNYFCGLIPVRKPFIK